MNAPRQQGKGRQAMSENEYRVFDLFEKQWALVTAGSM